MAMGSKDTSELDEIFGGNKMIIDNRCEKCENINICKWCEDMKATREYVNSIPKAIDSAPFNVKVICDKFKVKKEVPNGWTSAIR